MGVGFGVTGSLRADGGLDGVTFLAIDGLSANAGFGFTRTGSGEKSSFLFFGGGEGDDLIERGSYS
jgi:hypothetical protein